MKTMNDLKKRAEEIRDEKKRNQNTAERVGGLLVDMTDCFSDILKDSEDLINKVFPLTFRTFSGGGTFEVGQEVTPGLSWTLERKNEEVFPTSATVNGREDGVSSDFKSFTGTVISTDKSYRVTATCGTQSVERTASYSFRYKKYWGVSEKPVLDSADILVMSSSFATSKTMGRTVFNCTGGKYPYYVLPADMADGVEFWVNGFRNSDLDITEMEVTNSFNVTKKYKVIRLNNIQTGVLNVEFK